MSKKKIKIECKCGREFKTLRRLNLHKSKADHWVYPKPILIPPEERHHVNWIDLVGNGEWGRDMTKYEKKHPSREEIQLGYLAKIARLLESIDEELKRNKTIS